MSQLNDIKIPIHNFNFNKVKYLLNGHKIDHKRFENDLNLIKTFKNLSKIGQKISGAPTSSPTKRRQLNRRSLSLSDISALLDFSLKEGVLMKTGDNVINLFTAKIYECS